MLFAKLISGCAVIDEAIHTNSRNVHLQCYERHLPSVECLVKYLLLWLLWGITLMPAVLDPSFLLCNLLLWTLSVNSGNLEQQIRCRRCTNITGTFLIYYSGDWDVSRTWVFRFWLARFGFQLLERTCGSAMFYLMGRISPPIIDVHIGRSCLYSLLVVYLKGCCDNSYALINQQELM
jgi:hypothetical protein